MTALFPASRGTAKTRSDRRSSAAPASVAAISGDIVPFRTRSARPMLMRACYEGTYSRSAAPIWEGYVISTAARDRVKLSIDQLEELYHAYDERASADVNDSYEAALNRGKALAFQEAAHLVKAALHDIDVKAL
ncbi:MAG: hypothetical protein FJ028_05370 [Chloroflexi bacterium]|nr:hypothetical protein [Chloroflexota bacterium]